MLAGQEGLRLDGSQGELGLVQLATQHPQAGHHCRSQAGAAFVDLLLGMTDQGQGRPEQGGGGYTIQPGPVQGQGMAGTPAHAGFLAGQKIEYVGQNGHSQFGGGGRSRAGAGRRPGRRW